MKWLAIPGCATCLAILLSTGPLSFCLPAQSADPPTEEQVNSILAKAREYADEYLSRLPDFLCLQITEQYRASRKNDRWKQGDTLASKLVFTKGREVRTLESINGRKPELVSSKLSHRPLTSEGEFGILLANVVGTSSAAEIRWDRWADLESRRVAVYRYEMSKEHSTMKLALSDLAQAVVPYHGEFSVDPDSGKVWQITSVASEIPEELATRSIDTLVSYAPVTIGGAEYLLPQHATVGMSTKSDRIRNELSFQRYQKFETGSTITFGQ